jgi:hypothetical protein
MMTENKNHRDMFFKENYLLGEVIEVPSINLSHNGKTKKTDARITKPNGQVIKTSSLSLDEIGKYEVKYETTIQGKRVSNQSEFLVQQKLYEVDKQNASASFGAHPYTPEVSGIIVSLNSGAKFIYNDIINLSGLTKETPVLELYLTPEKIGERDFEQVNIRFTDVYDASNYLDVAVNSSPAGIGHPVSYMRAGAHNQPLTGFEYGWDRLHRFNRYGYAFDMSFYGTPGNKGSLDKDGLVVAFNYEEKELHGKKGSASDTMVIDLNNHDHFDSIWEGFTTGEVKLEITADYLRKSSANFVIKNILGQDLSRTYVSDIKGPIINVDFSPYQDSQLPRALVNHPYRIFEALSRDGFSGVVNTIYEVYFDYNGSKEAIEVTNQSFIPTKSGLYTIVYKAIDESNNETIKTIDVQAITSYAAPILTINTQRQTKASVGEIIPVAGYQITGGIGNIITEIKIYKGIQEVELIDNELFMPLTTGTYRVVYEAKDYVSRISNPEYEVEIASSVNPFIYEDVILPWYFIDGKEYKLPQLEATYYQNNQITKKSTSIFVSDMLGTTELGNEYYVPRVANHGDMVTVTYKAGETEKSYQVPVHKTVSNQNYDLKRYFDASKEVAIRSNSNSVNFQTATNNSKVTFITALPIQNFEMRLSIDELDNFIGGVDIVLIDAFNPATKLTINLTGNRIDKNSTRLSVDNGKSYNLNGGFNGDQFTIGYDFLGNLIYADNKNVMIKLWDFTGFISDQVYVQLVFKNVAAKSIVHVHNISGQIFSSVSRDLITPLIILEADDSGQRKINDNYILKPAKVVDILDLETEFHVTVKDSKGEIVRDSQGLSLNKVDPTKAYSFELAQYGTYRVTYYSSDTSGNINQRNLFIVVPDDQKPEITYKGLMPNQAKLNELIVGSNATAIDNIDGEVNVYLYLVTPSGNVLKLPGNSFYATQVGVYTLRYMTFDKTGNTVIDSFDVTVK